MKLTTDQSLSQFFRASDDVTFYIISNRERSRSNFFLYLLSDQGSLGMTSSRNIAIGQESTSCEKLHDIAIDQQRPSFLGQEVLHDHLTLCEYDNQVELSLRLDVKQQKNKKFPLYVKTRSGKNDHNGGCMDRRYPGCEKENNRRDGNTGRSATTHV